MNHLEDTMPAKDQLANENPAMNEPSRLRRNFLLGTTLSAASAAVAAVAVAAGGAKAAIEVAQDDAVDSGRKKVRGYHLSEHIAQYYDTTRI